MRYIRGVFTVLVECLDVYAYHGVPDAERIVGHRYRIDFALAVEGTADETDVIGDTVDYAQTAEIAERIARENQFRTVERLAAVIAEQLVAYSPLIVRATVTVRKPLPPAPTTASAVGATVSRQK